VTWWTNIRFEKVFSRDCACCWKSVVLPFLWARSGFR
jgi:hypothetical protein